MRAKCLTDMQSPHFLCAPHTLRLSESRFVLLVAITIVNFLILTQRKLSLGLHTLARGSPITSRKLLLNVYTIPIWANAGILLHLLGQRLRMIPR